MSRYELADDIYACTVDGGMIFLDLKRNKYFGIDASRTEDIKPYVTFASGAGFPQRSLPIPSAAGTDALNFLIQAGLLVPLHDSKEILKPVSYAVEPSEQFFCEQQGSVSFRYVYQFVLSLLKVATYLRFKRIKALVDDCKLEEPTENEFNDEAFRKLAPLVSAFLLMRPWVYTAKDRCLLDSLILADFLRRNRIHANLILGVSNKPFVAHAWVQAGAVVLNDTSERVSMYAPILIA